MKLCIADPPYLGVAALWYGDGKFHGKSRLNGGGPRFENGPPKADSHPDAAKWDDPATHRAMLSRLIAEYDGWAVAMKPASLWHYLQWVEPGPGIHVCAWTKTKAMPTNARPFRAWEPVLISVPEGRRAGGGELVVKDWMTSAPPSNGFAGSKPRSWTRWVLDMLGYDPETDTVDDLFHGSGAVSAEVAQGVLL